MSNWLYQMCQSPQIVAVFLTAAIAAVVRWLQPQAKVVWGASHGFVFNITQQGNPPGPISQVYTGTAFVQNVGKGTAENIEIVLNYRPQHFQVWPALNYTTALNAENHFIINIANLGPKEFTTIEMLSANIDNPATLRVRTTHGDAKHVNIAPTRIQPKSLLFGFGVLLLMGLFCILYFSIMIFRHFVP